MVDEGLGMIAPLLDMLADKLQLFAVAATMWANGKMQQQGNTLTPSEGAVLALRK